MQAEIQLAELKAVVNALLDRLIAETEAGVVKISEERDYYWEVPAKNLFLVHTQPAQLDIGRLSDDWTFLRPLLLDRQQAFPLMLMHIAPILRYLSGER